MVANFDYTGIPRLLGLAFREKDERRKFAIFDLIEKLKKPLSLALNEARRRTPFIGSIRFADISEEGEIPERYSRTLSGIIITIPENEGDFIVGINLAQPEKRETEYLNTTPAPLSRVIFSVFIQTSERERINELAKLSGATL